MRRASHSREADVVSLMTSFARTGTATDLERPWAERPGPPARPSCSRSSIAGPGVADDAAGRVLPLFTAPSFRTFMGLACGFLAQSGKRTVCGMLTGAALSRHQGNSFHDRRRTRPAAAGPAIKDSVPQRPDSRPATPSPGGSSPMSRLTGPGLGEPLVRYRGQYCYVAALLPGHREPTRSSACANRAPPTTEPSGPSRSAPASTANTSSSAPSQARPGHQNKGSTRPSSSTPTPEPGTNRVLIAIA